MIKFGKNSVVTFTPIRVDKKLLRGDAIRSIANIKQLKKSGVTQIIDLRYPLEDRGDIISKFFEKILCKIFRVKYYNFKYSHKSENMPDMKFFNKINEVILNSNGQTFIHCRHGKRRTGICVAVYEIFHSGKSKKEILDELYNLGFKELHENADKIPDKVYKRLIKIYNNFIDKFYPDEPKLGCKYIK